MICSCHGSLLFASWLDEVRPAGAVTNQYLVSLTNPIATLIMAYVTWVFLIEGPIATYRAGRKAKSDQSEAVQVIAAPVTVRADVVVIHPPMNDEARRDYGGTVVSAGCVRSPSRQIQNASAIFHETRPFCNKHRASQLMSAFDPLRTLAGYGLVVTVSQQVHFSRHVRSSCRASHGPKSEARPSLRRAS